MTEKVLITVITVCFNSESTIARTMNSVLNQTYENYEYIIIDGKSTDRTLEIINGNKRSFGNKLQVVSEPDKGIYDAMNKGIKLARGRLVGLVNSDDYYEADGLEKIAAAYTGKDLEIVYGMVREITGEGKMKSMVFYHHDFMKEQMINHPSCFVTRETYYKIGYYDLEYRSSSDYDFLLKAYLSGKVTFTPVYEVISNFTLGGMSGNVSSHLETFKIWKKYGCISAKRYYLITMRTKLKKWIG